MQTFWIKTLLFPVLTLSLVGFLSGCGQEPAVKAPTGSPVNIVSTPAGAMIYVNGVKKAPAPGTINLPLNVPVLIAADLPGYRPQMQLCRPEPTSGGQTINFQMEPIHGIIVVQTDPKGANVLIDGNPVGPAPVTVFNMTIGEHSVHAELVGHLPQERRISVPPDGTPTAANLTLSSIIGSLSVTCPVPEARLSINGKDAGVTPYQGDLAEGIYEITLRKEGYAEINQKATVIRQEKTVLDLPLAELPASISVTSDPEDATLIFKGGVIGSAPHTLTNLAAGNYRIRAEKKGYDPEETTVGVERGREATVHLVLKPNTGEIHVTALPPGVSVYLDGKRVGTLEADPVDPKKAKIFVIRDLAAGVYEVKIAHKDGVPSMVRESVTVSKGQTIRTGNLKIWVPNAWIYTKSNPKPAKVQLEYQTKDEVVFRPMPGIQRRYSTQEVTKVEPIDIREPFDSDKPAVTGEEEK